MAENWLEMVEKQLFTFRDLARKNIFAFCVITFEPIDVQTPSAPQNDRLNLSFVKDFYVDGGKLARNGRKTAIWADGWGRFLICSLVSTDSNLILISCT